MSQESGEIREGMESVESVERDRSFFQPEPVLLEIDRFEEYLIEPQDLAKEEYSIFKHILKHYSPHIGHQQLERKIKQLKNSGELDKAKKMKNPPQREMKLKPYEKSVILYTLLVNEKHWKDLTVKHISKKVCVFLARKVSSIKKFINQMDLWFEPSQFFVEIRAKVRGKVTSVPTKHTGQIRKREWYIAQTRKRELRYQRRVARMIQRRARNQWKKLRQTKKLLQAQQKLATISKQIAVQLEQKDSKSQKSPKMQPDPLEDYQANLAIIDSIQDEYGVVGELIRQQYLEDLKSSNKKQAIERDLRQKQQQNSKLKRQLRSADYQYEQLRRRHTETQDKLREVQGKLNKSEKELVGLKLELDGRREETEKKQGEQKESEQKLAAKQRQLIQNLKNMGTDNADIKSQLLKCQSDKERYERDLQQMGTDNAGIKSQLLKCQSDKERFERDLQQMVTDNAGIKSQLLKCQSDNTILSQVNLNFLQKVNSFQSQRTIKNKIQISSYNLLAFKPLRSVSAILGHRKHQACQSLEDQEEQLKEVSKSLEQKSKLTAQQEAYIKLMEKDVQTIEQSKEGH